MIPLLICFLYQHHSCVLPNHFPCH